MKLEVGGWATSLCVCGGVSHSFPGSRGSREETELEMASLSVAAQPEVCPLKVWGGWYCLAKWEKWTRRRWTRMLSPNPS